MKRAIRLKGLTGLFKGKCWQATDLLRVGRLDSLEIVLDDSSVSRFHAELRGSERGWRIRDLGSTNGTRLNGNRLGTGQWPVQERDLLQFGEILLVVEFIEELHNTDTPTPMDQLRIEATACSSFDEALQGLAFDSQRQPRAGEQLVALVRAGHHLGHLEREEDLLQTILHDAVCVLDAQRGAIVLADPVDDSLKIRAVATGRAEPRATVAGRESVARIPYSQSLTQRCFSKGESILCQRVEEDPQLALAKSIAEGSMASVLCVLLRTPRKRLGVLHLDRSPWQKSFTQDDLFLADALAANVSAGIECAQLLRRQRDLFLETINTLAQSVELRDQYTGGHTQRVSNYSLLLAQQIGMSAEDLELIRIGTPLHDIGKIGIDDAILRKPDRLTQAEFEIMKTHTIRGEEIVSTIRDLHPIRPIVRSHHERWDGKGYPDGLRDGQISPLARVVALADAFDAMTSDRPYRRGMPAEIAFTEIQRGSGTQFDPTLTLAFLAIQSTILEAMQQSTISPPTARIVRPLFCS